MRTRLLGLVAVLIGVATTGVHGQQQVVFFASVVDGNGAPVATLAPDDIRLSENGVEGKVVNVEPIDWPVKVALLVDNGTGMGESLIHIRNGLKGLLEALPAGVEISLQTTAPQPRWVVRPTTDRQALIQGVDRIVPDTGAARFTEALNETAARFQTEFEKERGDAFPVVIMLGSTNAEGSQIRDRDLTRMMERYVQRAATVHVVMVSARPGGSITGGVAQGEIGMAVTKLTGGRYENIAAISRIGTLLPEIGAQVAKSHARQSKQFRVTFDRPNPSVPIGDIRMATRSGTGVTLTLNGRMP
jgi:hypothetical protein